MGRINISVLTRALVGVRTKLATTTTILSYRNRCKADHIRHFDFPQQFWAETVENYRVHHAHFYGGFKYSAGQ